MCGQDRTDEKIARLASRSHGVVTRRRLLAAGVTSRQIEWRVARGSLIVVHPGVYRVGHRAPSTEATYMAAVLACGDGALLMGAAAAHLYGLIRGQPPMPAVRTRTERRIEGIETHRTRRSERGTEWRGIPITTIPATLVDIAPSMPTDQLARACHEAQVRFNIRPEAFPPRMPRTLRALLSGDIPITLSELERRFLERLREQGLPLPITNRRAGTKYIDFRRSGHRP